MGRPRYIAFEGIDGAGKSTVASRFAGALEAAGEPVVRVREPGGTEVGERIRSILLGHDLSPSPWAEALLFAAARAQLAADVIAPALDTGSWVVADRSVYSSLAYQGAGRGLGVDTVRAVNEAGLDGVWPDLVVLLEVDAERALARQDDPDRIGAEGIAFQSAVGDAFAKIAAAERERFLVVDANAELDPVIDAVVAAVGVGR
jgi:dTMP kinase